ncbi:MAG: metallophosphoesterase [Hyphomicrobiales bacterium]|nr:metallophosphoesterase [Hyphomicrobiales bacterium]
MRTIAHLSDLHFGRHDTGVVEGITRLIDASRPDLIVISGDLTQRARTHEFELAREFLGKLREPVLVVPGNHDVPLYDVSSRWLRPLVKYRRFITEDLQPSFLDDEIAVVGINTARSLTWKNGRINERQMEACCERLAKAPASAARIVVTHHPFDLPPAARGEAIVGRATMAMSRLVDCGVDIIISGHLHIRHNGSSATRYQTKARPILLVQAGTATSTRQRGELNSCNLIRIDRDSIFVDWFVWNAVAHSFEVAVTERFERDGA